MFAEEYEKLGLWYILKKKALSKNDNVWSALQSVKLLSGKDHIN